MSRHVLALLATSLFLCAAALPAPPSEAAPAARPAAPSPARAHWVFFVDHGSAASKAASRREAEEILLNPRRLERLKRVNPDGPWIMENDLAVAPEYVDAVVRLGAAVRHQSRWFNALSVTAPEGALERIARLPFVREVRPVAGWFVDHEETEGPLPAPARAAVEPRARFYGPSITQLALIRADALQDSGYTGDGIMVAMLDSGFKKSHPAFARTHLVAEHDFVKNDGNTENEANDVISQHTHGTGTWAVVGGYAPGSLIGFAPFADFILAKTEDVPNEAHIEEDNWVAAAEWADGLGASVISSSLAYRQFDSNQASYTYGDMDGHTTIVALGAREAIRRGIVVVTAMGNEAQTPGQPVNESIWSPADADSAVSVGAVDASRVIAGFSSQGPTSDGQTKPEVCALGVSTIWADAPSNGYGSASGTSLSTPCIGGAVALLLEAHPTWGPGNVLAALRATGDRADMPDDAFGYGIPDIARASYFGGSRAAAHRPWPFALVSPIGQTVDNCRPTFTWRRSRSGVNGPVTYRLEIDDDPQFATPFTVSGITDTTYTPSQALPVGGLLSWRVIAVAPNTKERESYFSETFTIHGATITTSLEAPASGASLAAIPTFRWRRPAGSSADSTRFSLLYGTNSALTGALRIDVGNDTTYTPALPLPQESTTHYWRVEAVDPTQCGFGASIIRSFVSAPYPPTAVAVLAPAEGDTFDVLPINFRWHRSSDPNPADEVHYRLELTPELGTPVHFDSPDSVLAVTALGSVGRITWRVMALDRFNHATPSTETRTLYYLPASTPYAALGAPRPNPFGPATQIPIVVPGSAGSAIWVTVSIFDIDGRLVRKLLDRYISPGPQNVPWDGDDANGRAAPNGVYYVRFDSPSGSYEKKLVRVR